MKISNLIYYIFILVLGVVAFLTIASAFPVTGNFKLLAVQSGSMEPAIKPGSVVVIRPAQSYQVGEIITFGQLNSKNKTPITHRIIEIKNSNGRVVYLTKGDANRSSDKREVLTKEVIGKVLFSLPYAGYVINTAKKPIGFILIIGLPAILIIFDEIRKIKNEIARIRQNKKASSVC